MGPFGSSIKVETFVADGVPVISGQHLQGFEVNDTVGYNFITEEHADRLKKANVERGDVVFTHAGSIGQAAMVPHDAVYDRYVISQRQFYLRCDPKKAIPEYVVAYFKSPQGQHALLANSSQVGVPSIARPVTYLRSIAIPLPPLDEQRAIASVLGALDDKIEQNQRTAQALERLARAIFRAWFVDFEPVKAKAAGATAFPSMPQPVFDALPTRFVDSTIGPVPEGWEVARLTELADIKGGKQLPTDDCKAVGRFPVYGANGIMGYADRPTHEGFVIAFGRVGAYCGSIHWRYGGAWINNNASAVVPRSWPEFVLQAMLETDFERMRRGSAQPFIPNSSLAALEIVVPSNCVLTSFSDVANSLRLKENALIDESRKLAEMRDYLLPKLLSGNVQVKDAARTLETTA